MTPVPSTALAIPAYGRPDYLARLLARVPADVRAFVSDNAASLRDSGMAVGGNVVVSASVSLLAMFANWNRALSLVPDDATHVLVPSDDDLYLPGAFARIADVIIAWNCTVYDHDSHSLDWRNRADDIRQQNLGCRAGLNMIANKNWATVKSRPIIIGDKS